MKSLKSIIVRKSGKQDRERKVLLGLVDLYLKTGKPVGSNTLKEAGFEDLSSATIRNYFASLEEGGYLSRQHSSGGRIPTHEAFRLYAQEYLDAPLYDEENSADLRHLRKEETREIASYLQKAAEKLSLLSNCAVFLSAPRFDHDFVTDFKLLPIDHHRCLCILITDFGMVQTELIHVDKKLSTLSSKRIEEYFHWRLTGASKPTALDTEEELLGQKIYNELMLRYIVGYSNFTDPEIYRTGFSKLIAYPEYQDVKLLAASMALFENAHSMRLLLKESAKHSRLRFWIGDDLLTYSTHSPECAVMAIPYRINNQIVGAIGLLGPTRLPYRHLFGLMRTFADCVSEAITRNLFKFKIQYRQPESGNLYLRTEDRGRIGQSRLMLLEDKSQGAQS